MYASTILATLLGASTAVLVQAAPAWPQPSGDVNAISEYFNQLAQTVDVSKLLTSAPTCDLSKAKMPTLSTTPLPAVAANQHLKHVAIGRGTQNYTCDTTNATAVPVANGAVATLFNASCLAATYPALLHTLPKLALSFDLSLLATINVRLGPTNLALSGTHYFTNATTPFFNLDTNKGRIGDVACSKKDAKPAPANAPKGRAGEAAVPWLFLTTNPETYPTGEGIQSVYRVETAGGSAPATCKGMPATFEVHYATEYWFFATS